MRGGSGKSGGAVSEAACGAGAYLTDLEVELAPPLLRLEAEHGGEHHAQGSAWLHIHEYFHLEFKFFFKTGKGVIK